MERNKILVLIISFIIVTPVLVVNIFSLFGNPSDEKSDDSSNVIQEVPMEFYQASDPFPQDNLSYVIKVDFVKGDNASANDLDELKYLDGDKYEVEGSPALDGFELDIRFQFDFNLVTHFLKHFDLYLFMHIAPSSFPQTAYFQSYTNNSWVNITEITDSAINYNWSYIELTTEFRIFGFNETQKVIEIDDLYVLLTHGGRMEDRDFSSGGIIDDSAGGGEKYITSGTWVNGKGSFKQEIRDMESPFTTKVSTTIEVEITLDIDEYKGVHQINYIGINYAWFPSTFPPFSMKMNIYVFNYDLGENGNWELYQTYTYLTWGFTWRGDLSDYIDNNKFKFKIYTELTQSIPFPKTNSFTLKNAYADFHYDYPEVNDIYTNPDSPIDTLQLFEIKSEVFPWGRDITNVKYYIENYSAEWVSMTREGITNIWTGILTGTNFQNGIYRLWINAFDSDGSSTLNYTFFELYNSPPNVKFVYPEDLEVINVSYYLVKVTAEDEELDFISSVELKVYSTDPNNSELNWTEMMQDGFTENWTLIINLVDLLSFKGNYTFAVRASDGRSYGYNETDVVVDVFLFPFKLSSNAGDPDVDGKFLLSWTSYSNADNYSLYRSNKIFNESTLNESILSADGITEFSYTVSGLTDGTYYFLVIAFNETINASSNTIELRVRLYIPPLLQEEDDDKDKDKDEEEPLWYESIWLWLIGIITSIFMFLGLGIMAKGRRSLKAPCICDADDLDCSCDLRSDF